MNSLHDYPRTNAIFASQKHPFHILPPSNLPFLTGVFLLFFLLLLTFSMHGVHIPSFFGISLTHVAFLGLFVVVMTWFIAIVVESGWGYHTRKVVKGLSLGMILFILSEIMFFFAFFWAFFHFSLVPVSSVGAIWPPEGTQVLDAWGLPLVNTLLLLSSGVTITAAHAGLLKRDGDKFYGFLFMTILLGTIFLFCQAYEYTAGVKFSWRDNAYGSVFFITTGFHGLHVTIGTLFLAFCCIRQYAAMTIREDMGQRGAEYWYMTSTHHLGFEAAAWYWHFVDVVWLFLFLTIYWWGGA